MGPIFFLFGIMDKKKTNRGKNMEEIMIGSNLRRIRLDKGLTLEEAGKQCQVSALMLGRIERMESSPTIHMLSKIATGLKVPISTLIQTQNNDMKVILHKDKKPIKEEGGKIRAYPLLVYDPIQNYELFYIEFDPRCLYRSQTHGSGSVKLLTIASGSLTIQIEGKQIVLQKGDCIRLAADAPHTYTTHEKGAKFFEQIFY